MKLKNGQSSKKQKVIDPNGLLSKRTPNLYPQMDVNQEEATEFNLSNLNKRKSKLSGTMSLADPEQQILDSSLDQSFTRSHKIGQQSVDVATEEQKPMQYNLSGNLEDLKSQSTLANL